MPDDDYLPPLPSYPAPLPPSRPPSDQPSSERASSSSPLRLPEDNPLGDVATSSPVRPTKPISSSADSPAIRHKRISFAASCATRVRSLSNLFTVKDSPRIEMTVAEQEPLTPEELALLPPAETPERLLSRPKEEAQMLGIKREGEKIAPRTRYDLLRYADQITTAGFLGVDGTYKALADFAARHIDVKDFDSGNSEYKAAYNLMNEHVRSLPRSPDFSGLSPLQTRQLMSENVEERALALRALRAAYRQPVSAADEEVIKRAEAQLERTGEVCVRASERLVDSFRAQVIQDRNLSADKRQMLLAELQAIRRGVPKLIRRAREEMIHSRKEWSGRRIDYPVALRGREGRYLTVTSAYRAIGPPKSSACARCQPPTDPIVPNFFESLLLIPAPGKREPPDAMPAVSSSSGDEMSLGSSSSGDEMSLGSSSSSEMSISPARSDDEMTGEELSLTSSGSAAKVAEAAAFRASRSAIPVEFCVDDPVERQATTLANVKKILEFHTNEVLSDITDFSGNDEEHPIMIDYQHLMLMTPDLARNVGAAVSSDIVFRADDERLLVEEMDDVLRGCDGLKEYRWIVVDDKPKTKVWIQYDVSGFNIPCNRLQEKLITRMSPHGVTDEMNARSLAKMGRDVAIVTDRINADLQAIIEETPLAENERVRVGELNRLMTTKRACREEMARYVLGRKEVPQTVIDRYTRAADAVVKVVKEGHQSDASAGFKNYLELLEKREVITDLYADLHELISTRAYLRPEVLDGNRYAIGSRLLALGFYLDRRLHFGCRSGKDRTGIQDDDVKQLIAEIILNGRVPCYLEVERWPSHKENTRTMLHESGNADFNPRANLGGLRWYNVLGAQRTDKDNTHPMYSDIASFAKLFKRP